MQNQLTAVQTVEHANEIKLTESETVSNLTAQAASLGMVPVGTVEYIARPASGVAMR
jgi:2-iminoacetate synthase ThiH